MDQDIFRQTYDEINECYCAFEKGILTNNCECSQAERFCIAEREGVKCKQAAAQQDCIDLLEILRQQARFALRADNRQQTKLPHGKAMRVQIGGLRGLYQATCPDQPAVKKVKDVYALLRQALAKFKQWDALPFQMIIQQMADWKGREPRRRPR
ncbi:MAG: hypothetical protein KZQ58_12505 [gamma proteobacterium symbiont of Bathyaustriella thionipta]|nr:hypothetical protein [gamma proteobacterium symbiont of Bathyaustriella thionipta]